MVAMKLLLGSESNIVTSGSFMPFPKPVRSVVSRVGTNGLRGQLALDTTDLSGYTFAP